MPAPRVIPPYTAAALLSAAGLSGCSAPRVEPVALSDRSDQRIPALVAQARDDGVLDDADLDLLIANLNADDPAVRAFAAEALLRHTGLDFGYRYYQDAAARAPAVARWRRWRADAGRPPAHRPPPASADATP